MRLWVSDISQLLKVLTDKVGDPSSVPERHIIEREN